MPKIRSWPPDWRRHHDNGSETTGQEPNVPAGLHVHTPARYSRPAAGPRGLAPRAARPWACRRRAVLAVARLAPLLPRCAVPCARCAAGRGGNAT